MTAAQRRALEAIRDERVNWHTPWSARRESSFQCRGTGVRIDTIQRVIDAGLAEVGPRDNPLFAPVVLTDAGREALR